MIYESIKNKIKNISVKPNDTIEVVLKKMDETERKLLLVIDSSKFYGLVSIGDIQRTLIKNTDLKISVRKIIRKDIKVGSTSQTMKEIKNMMLIERIEFMPVLDDYGNLAEIYFWEDIISGEKKLHKKDLNIPVCIIAGGKGTRLKPLTNVIPKPLLPVNEKPIIRDIIDKFKNYGVKKFYISVNYKADIIKYYFNSNIIKNTTIKFIKEKKPLGTAGGLSLFKRYINSAFFVTNCDILIDQDYSEVFEYHKLSGNEITIITSLKSFSIPYGIVKAGKKGKVLGLVEKPNISYYINTGMYILEPELLREIPENTYFHMTELIEIIKSRSGNIGFYPVSEGSLIDIGSWEEYKKYV